MDLPSGRKRAARKRVAESPATLTMRPVLAGSVKTSPRAVNTALEPSGEMCTAVR